MKHRIAILIDGGFFLKRLRKLVPEKRRDTPGKTAVCIRYMCRRHVQILTGDTDSRWHKHVYRIFFYDAKPYTGQAHHPFLNRQIDFGKSDVARFRNELFEYLRKQRKVALRLGDVIREGDWALPDRKAKRILATRNWIAGLVFPEDGSPIALTEAQIGEARRLQTVWAEIRDNDLSLGLRQKGVDMRIGLDITSITLKKQADTIILVAGDSDFVPAAKLARREGVEFILDPMWQKVSPGLFEHIDGLQSGLPKPGAKQPEPPNGGEEKD